MRHKCATEQAIQKRRCYYCYQKIVTDPPNYQIDHKIPIYKGGNNALRNLCIACRGCNQYKSYHQMSQSKTARRLARNQEHRERALVIAKQMDAFMDAEMFAMSISILFFQASATIIPTLFITVAFTSKALAPGDEHVLGMKKGNRAGYLVTLYIFLLPISSEAVALATLAANRLQSWPSTGC